MKTTHQPKVILVTGGAGFIGSNFVRYLVNHDPSLTIFNIDKLTYAGSLENLHDLYERHSFRQGDICNFHVMRQIVKHDKIDTIIQFAAESHVDRSIESPAPFIETNLVGTFQMLEIAKEYHCRFHHISTDEVYGSLNKDDPAFTENSPYKPNSPYSASKAGSDHLVRAYHHTYGLKSTITCCSNNYGPYQHPEKFIPTVIEACLMQKPIPIYGDGSNIRDWLFVEDHCDAIYKVVCEGEIGETYNIGGAHEASNLEVATLICTLMDERNPQNEPHANLIQFVDDRPGHDFRYAINAEKIHTKLGWKPTTKFKEGLAKTLDFYTME